MRHYIYTIKNKLNNKIYVGQTKNPERRWEQHQYDCFIRLETWTRLYYSMRKYGVDNFIYTIVKDYDISEIDEAEKQWIIELNTLDRKFGYNNEAGGSTNKEVSAETRIKMGNARRGKHHTEASKKLISDAKIGIKRTEESKKKQSTSNTGRTHSSETKQKISESNMGKIMPPHTLEARQKMSDTRRGEKNVRAKLKDADIPVIRNLISEGISDKEISIKFQVAPVSIWKIRTGRSWKHIK